MDNFACLNSSLSLFYFYFVTNVQKKITAYVRLLLNLPPPPIRASTLLAGPPHIPSERTYFMDNPNLYLQKVFLERTYLHRDHPSQVVTSIFRWAMTKKQRSTIRPWNLIMKFKTVFCITVVLFLNLQRCCFIEIKRCHECTLQ